MRGKIKKGIALVLSAVLTVATCITAIPELSATVYAAGTGKDIQLGAGALAPEMTSVKESYDWDTKSRVTTAQTVYYGSKEWRVIGLDGSGAVNESGTVTLFASDNLKTGQRYKEDNSSNSYVGSDIKPVVDGYYTSLFSSDEQNAIKARTLAHGDYSSDYSNFCDGISDTSNPEVKLWLLSTKEADLIGQSYRTASDFWWLRSPGDFASYAAGVDYRGSVHYDGRSVDFSEGVRPAFNLNLSSIIFTSDAAGIKSSGAAGTLSAPGSHSTENWKLTVESDNLSASTSGTVTRSGSTITVPFTASGSYDRISVFISDGTWNSSGAELKYYGALDTSGSSGTFTLPDDYETSWKVYILAEKINGNSATDYASTPAEITIPDGTEYTITCSNDGNGTASASATSATAGTEITLTATPNGGYAFKEWQVVSGGVTITNNKFTMPASNVEVKAIFEALPPSTYSVTMTNDGHGSATATPTSGTTGTTVTIKATASNGYQFKEWVVESGGVTLASTSSATTTFDIVDSNVKIKAVFEKKSGGGGGSKDDDSDDSGSGSEDSKPKDEKPFDYLDELRAKLATAISLGGEQTVTWDKGTALPYDIMKTLQDNPKITLVFSYSYQNVDFKVTLPGKSVKADIKIPWYGPLYLYAYYGGRGAVQNAPKVNTANRTYTVVKGDTLTGIAIKLNTTVKSLVSFNNIKDPDKLKIGQVLKY